MVIFFSTSLLIVPLLHNQWKFSLCLEATSLSTKGTGEIICKNLDSVLMETTQNGSSHEPQWTRTITNTMSFLHLTKFYAE